MEEQKELKQVPRDATISGEQFLDLICDLAALRERQRRGKTLVVITGPSGVGKTHFAERVGDRVDRWFKLNSPQLFTRNFSLDDFAEKKSSQWVIKPLAAYAWIMKGIRAGFPILVVAEGTANDGLDDFVERFAADELIWVIIQPDEAVLLNANRLKSKESEQNPNIPAAWKAHWERVSQLHEGAPVRKHLERELALYKRKAPSIASRILIVQPRLEGLPSTGWHKTSL